MFGLVVGKSEMTLGGAFQCIICNIRVGMN